ncbi:hypothetical protein ACP4J4_10370 [Aureimonas ureilytica]|uniref:hypothetical protein n=1 Tax=Aureimonas ureilytica TaxID=401562 RepID=UPI003CED525A
MPNIANTSRGTVVLIEKGGEPRSVAPGETASFDLDKDHPANAAAIGAGIVVVGGTKAQAEKVAAQGAGPATPQVEKPEKAA